MKTNRFNAAHREQHGITEASGQIRGYFFWLGTTLECLSQCTQNTTGIGLRNGTRDELGRRNSGQAQELTHPGQRDGLGISRKHPVQQRQRITDGASSGFGHQRQRLHLCLNTFLLQHILQVVGESLP